MQTAPRHHVGFGAEDIADAILDVNQFDQTKASVVGIEEEIDIAVRPGLLADNGVEQIEPDDRLPPSRPGQRRNASRLRQPTAAAPPPAQYPSGSATTGVHRVF